MKSVMRTFRAAGICLSLAAIGTMLPLQYGAYAQTGGDVAYTYDELGRLETVSYSDGTLVTYAYDAAGNRTSQVIAGSPGGGGGGFGLGANIVVVPLLGFTLIPVRDPNCGIVGGC